MPHEKSRNLILVNHPTGQARGDLEEIAAKIEALAPEIAVHIVPHDVAAEANGLAAEIWSRPTLTVSFQFPLVFRPKRGEAYCGWPLDKLVQLKRFQAGGIPFPPALIYRLGTALDPRQWGEMVILKPSCIGFQAGGHHTFLLPTARIAELAGRAFPAGHRARRAPLLVQRFIDTGAHSVNFRVLCLFGEPLYCMEQKLVVPRPPPGASDEELLKAPVASNALDQHTRVLNAPPDVLDFARRVAGAMPKIPLQGIDIIREERTGKLFVLENNPGGNTWHFSSKLGEEGRRHLSRAQRMAQFGAWDVAARVLADRTIKEAR